MFTASRNDATRYDPHTVFRFVDAFLPAQPKARHATLQTWAQSKLQPFKQRSVISAGELRALAQEIRASAPPLRASEDFVLLDNHRIVADAFAQVVEHLHELPVQGAPTQPFFGRLEQIGDQLRTPRITAIRAPERPKAVAKPLPRPDHFISPVTIMRDLRVDHKSSDYKQFWADLCELAEHMPRAGDGTVTVMLDGQAATMGFYRSHRRDSWCIDQNDFPKLSHAFEQYKIALHGDRVAPREKSLPSSNGFINKSTLWVTLGVDHYHDPEFNPMWEELTALAEKATPDKVGNRAVQWNDHTFTMKQVTNGTRTTWNIETGAIEPLRAYILEHRAQRVPTATVTERQLFGRLQVSKALGLTLDTSSFNAAWTQLADVAAKASPTEPRITLHSDNGDIQVVRAGTGDKLPRWSIDKESIPVFGRAVERMRFVQHVNWRANSGPNTPNRDMIYICAFTDSWAELEHFCRDQDLGELSALTGIPSARAALFLTPNKLSKAFEKLESRTADGDARALELGVLLNHVRDSRTTARGEEVQLFSR